MTKLQLFFMLLILFMSTKGFSQEGLWTDEGNYDTSWYDETSTEFTLTTPAQLAGLAKLVNDGNEFYGKTIKLGTDINLGAHCWWPIGDNSAFRGTFDGQGKSICELKMIGEYYKESKYIAFFGYFTGNLRDLNMDASCYIAPDDGNTESYIGGIIAVFNKKYGEGETSSVVRCTSKAAIFTPLNNRITGGIIASCSSSQSPIESCINYSDIHNEYLCGGIIGTMNGFEGTLLNCENYGSISAQYKAGGIVGEANGNISFESCINHGKIAVNNSDKLYFSTAGGIVGVTMGQRFVCQFTSCINKGKIASVSKAGGICGEKNCVLKFFNCVNRGYVTAERWAGGITVGNYGTDTYIDRCTNFGTVKSFCSDYTLLSGNDAKLYAAGICAWYADCINCSNRGEVSATGHSVGPRGAFVNIICNGICGLGNAYNCFNSGAIAANCHFEATEEGYLPSCMLSLSGIIDLGNANNCYNSGPLTHSLYIKNKGYASRKFINGISANHSNMPITITHCYYANEGIEFTPNGGNVGFIPFSEMQTQAFADQLNLGKTDLGNYKAASWISDPDNENFPNFVVLPTGLFVVNGESIAQEHPLFIQSIVSTTAWLNMEIKEKTDVFLYNLNGMLMDKLNIETNRIDVSKYENGNYIIIVKGKDVYKRGKLIIRH